MEHLVESRLVIGGRKTSITNTVMSTHYNVQTVTNRVTETPKIDSKTLAGTNPLQALIQNILATLLGKNLLLAGVAAGGGGVIPETEVVTHTRSYLTSFVSSQTIVIPVTLRGQEVYKTVTDAVTQTVTTTQYSEQTIVRQKQAQLAQLAQPEPARRKLPSLASLARTTVTTPSPILVTHPLLALSTITTLDTSSLVVTLAGRAITTTYNQPKTQVSGRI